MDTLLERLDEILISDEAPRRDRIKLIKDLKKKRDFLDYYLTTAGYGRDSDFFKERKFIDESIKKEEKILSSEKDLVLKLFDEFSKEAQSNDFVQDVITKKSSFEAETVKFLDDYLVFPKEYRSNIAVFAPNFYKLFPVDNRLNVQSSLFINKKNLVEFEKSEKGYLDVGYEAGRALKLKKLGGGVITGGLIGSAALLPEQSGDVGFSDYLNSLLTFSGSMVLLPSFSYLTNQIKGADDFNELVFSGRALDRYAILVRNGS